MIFMAYIYTLTSTDCPETLAPVPYFVYARFQEWAVSIALFRDFFSKFRIMVCKVALALLLQNSSLIVVLYTTK